MARLISKLSTFWFGHMSLTVHSMHRHVCIFPRDRKSHTTMQWQSGVGNLNAHVKRTIIHHAGFYMRARNPLKYHILSYLVSV